MVNIDEEDLYEMMLEYWALDNNEDCHKKTIEFCKKYNLDLEEINIGEQYN
jgi:hypothetical protein